MKEEIDIIRAKLAELDGDVPVAIEPYRRRAPRVGCFSFDWHRLRPFDGRAASAAMPQQ